jgi:hypothetical protein
MKKQFPSQQFWDVTERRSPRGTRILHPTWLALRDLSTVPQKGIDRRLANPRMSPLLGTRRLPLSPCLRRGHLIKFNSGVASPPITQKENEITKEITEERAITTADVISGAPRTFPPRSLPHQLSR